MLEVLKLKGIKVKQFLRITIVMATLFFGQTILADPQLYQVELIVFSHINAGGVNSETWPILNDPQINLSRALALSPLLENTQDSTAAPASYQILPNFNFSLNKIGDKLIQTNGYNVIMHVAWRQPIDDPHSAKWIHIFGGTGYDNEGNAIAQDMDGSANYDQAQHWQVDGLLRLNMVRYINSQYDFTFAATAGTIQDLSTTDNFSKVDAPLVYFKLDQTRRMRSDELNYIGHPLYGVLINITKIDNSKAPTLASPAS
jgi:hypothetical protein